MNTKRMNRPRKRAWSAGTAAAATLGLLWAAAPARAQRAVDCDTSACDVCVDSGTEEIDHGVVTNCFEVAAGAILNITADGTLTVRGTGDQKKSLVNGTVNLLGNGVNVATLAFTNNDHTITGSGIIDGQDDDAVISMSVDVTPLTSYVDITGHLEITGAGDFANAGRVIADNPSGTLDITVSGGVTDVAGTGSCTATARWKVDASWAVLRFNQDMECPSAELLGDFYAKQGRIAFGEDNVTTADVDTTGECCMESGGEFFVVKDSSFSCSVASCP